MTKNLDGSLKPSSAWDFTSYMHDASGNVLNTITSSNGPSNLSNEYSIYGSSRLGVWSPNIPSSYLDSLSAYGDEYRLAGDKVYELSNHLENVMVVVSDKKLGYDNNSDDYANLYHADVVSMNDYYAFGMIMPERTYSSPNYRYGFNGKEKDDETYSVSGSSYDYGFRIYNSRLGRFLSVDPLFRSYPWLSTYQFAQNDPIRNIDIDGLEGGSKIETALWNFNAFLVNHTWAPLFSLATGENMYLDYRSPNAPAQPVIKDVTKPVIAKVTSSDEVLGQLSEQWESGGKGPGTVSASNNGDPGGVSYGIWQFSSVYNVPNDFFANEGSQWASQLEGLEQGSSEFTAVWKKIAKENPVEFRQAQYDYVKRTHFDKLEKRVFKQTGLDINGRSKVLRDVMWSTAVQHGASNNVFKNALKGKDVANLTDAEIIDLVYNERSRVNEKGKMVYFTQANDEWQKNLKSRFKQEKKEALKQLKAE